MSNYANNEDDSFSIIHFYAGATKIIEFSFFIWVFLFPLGFYSCFAGCEGMM